jgi:hypothetical protein
MKNKKVLIIIVIFTLGIFIYSERSKDEKNPTAPNPEVENPEVKKARQREDLERRILGLQAENELKQNELARFVEKYGRLENNNDRGEADLFLKKPEITVGKVSELGGLKSILAELELENRDLNQRLAIHRKRAAGLRTEIPKIKATVLQAEVEILMINKGSKDGVYKGLVFSIINNGKFVTTALCQSVLENSSILEAEKLGTQKGDVALTKP